MTHDTPREDAGLPESAREDREIGNQNSRVSRIMREFLREVPRDILLALFRMSDEDLAEHAIDACGLLGLGSRPVVLALLDSRIIGRPLTSTRRRLESVRDQIEATYQ